jgi:hypothetical protein
MWVPAFYSEDGGKVSEEHTAFYSENGDVMFLLNVGTHQPDYTVS